MPVFNSFNFRHPTLFVELNNDHGAIDGYPQDMFIDYYNTYTPGNLYLQDVIDKLDAEETRTYP